VDTKIEQPDTSDADSKSGEKLSLTGIKALQGEGETKSEWRDHGIIDVPVNDLPDPDSVSSPQDFNHHISWKEAQAATKQLPEIQKQVAKGKTGDDFSAEDQAAGLDNSQGKRRIYDLYYGSDPVTVDKDGSKYDIVSGRHRIFAAKEAGLQTIPAHVREKTQS